MKKSEEIEELIYQSIKDSKHFEDWDRYVKVNPSVGKQPIENLWK